ncbi:McrB family protein [Psychrobacter sp. SZ93C1]|uniref:McrB family protein n=1 Tax=Psychrobacter sp. SZ93C1 TaxID=2792058 RepID=UPI0018CF2190|nr:hypothetical protein [Psychrobacter sp. SZ93C1]MBH0064412.1 hypothetical protein [Psychrobacter sp. SZ93C1]
MQDLNGYFSSVSSASNFQCKLGELGGFINFTNSGQRGLKEFTVSLKSILTGLQDIIDNMNAFENHSIYVEKDWRDLGSKYFTDLVLQSMITVQTKPCFATFSKVISWANDVDPLEHDDNIIDLRVDSLKNAIAKIKALSHEFTPTNASQLSPKIQTNQNTTIISKSIIGIFAYELIEFLVNKNLDSPLFQYLIEKNSELGSYNIEFNGHRLTSIFKMSDEPIHENELRRGDKLRFFAEPIKVGKNLYYLSNQWTDSTDSRLDVQTLITIFNELYDDYKILKENECYVLIQVSQEEQKSLPDDVTPLSKPFLLLAGISGTGKTRFVREQAKATGSLSDTYCLTSVRPDWHEPSDILGYISRLGGDGDAEYITTDVLQFIAKAWRTIIDAKLELTVDDDCRLTVTGNKDALNKVRPYWLCLDEMNLAPVEQYFADYLSVLETREWQWDDEQFIYCCDPLLKSATIDQLKDKNKNELRNALGFADGKYDREWELFCKHGLSLPFNLIVAGTVNMDETTHGFSRKVIDRALSFDFGDFFPNEFDDFFEPKVTHNALIYPTDSQASIDKLPPIDNDGSKSINFLKSINKVLDNTPFKLAFRALNELLLAVISTQPTDELQLQAVWDDFLMCKVLPRIEGDYDKLAIINKAISSNEQSLLTELAVILQQALSDIWSTTNDTNKQRPDLYRKNADGSILSINCRSKAKLAWMQQRLERSGFTSFWP